MTRRLPPVWLMGFLANLPIGVGGAIMLLTLPQLLAARQMPEPQIAIITAIGLAPSFCSFLLAPILDWRFNRRSYAILLSLLAAGLQFAMLLSLDHPVRMTAFLFAAQMAISLTISAFGGWLGVLVPQKDKAQLGAWYAISSIGSFGVVAIAAILLLREIPYVLGAGLVSLLLLTPMTLCWLLPVIAPDHRLARESFAIFFRSLATLLRQREILWTLLLFALPSASFALTNILGGIGADFGASEKLVAFAGGSGATLAGIVGSLLMPVLLVRLPPRGLYLLVGMVGAGFTLALIPLHPTPMLFVVAMVGENLFQAAAFAVEYTIILRSIGEANPFAATQFALINAATSLPISYMQMVDGQAYGLGGLKGALLADGGLTILACAVLAGLLGYRRLRRQRLAIGKIS